MSRGGGGLSGRQRHALHVLERCARVDGGWGVVGSETAVIDGQAWVHWRTAGALEARGLVEIDRSWGPEAWLLRLVAS